ncbi:hypothetical protein [Afipia sp. Root123D2]|uniref:hypothetical protein n=1 Tax=Afipia sp. Root123D2 TaxID=1736436 RepID=UPI0006FD3109|nr:hypothetical protein [Afipia sp. Root123D2]
MKIQVAPDGKPLKTLRDAAEYSQKLPKAEQRKDVCGAATGAVRPRQDLNLQPDCNEWHFRCETGAVHRPDWRTVEIGFAN